MCICHGEMKPKNACRTDCKRFTVCFGLRQNEFITGCIFIENAEGIIGVDTGLLHLANALEKPVVGIYTDTDPAKTGVQVSAYAKI